MIRTTPAEYSATVLKVEAINARAAKRGFTGRLAVEAERVVVTTTNEFGFDVTQVFYDVAVTGEAPKYNGWTFLARVDTVGETFTLATAPGIDYVGRDLVKVGHCDHCGQQRNRKNTYLVQGEDGVLNVGSTCIKDFLGWDANVVFLSVEDVEREISGVMGNTDPTFTVDTVLAVAIAATKVCGFVRSGDYNAQPTADRVRHILSNARTAPADQATYDQIKAAAQQAVREVEHVKQFIMSNEFSGNSTYAENLKALVSEGTSTYKQIGLLASAPQALTRYQERLAGKQVEAQAQAERVNDYIAEVKDKITITGVINAIRYIDGDYGTTTLYTIVTDQGLVKWFSSTGALGDTTDRVVTLKGTVKAHDEYNGIKSTVLTRCKEVA